MKKLIVLLLAVMPTLAFAAAGDVNQSYVTPENAQASFVALTATGATAAFDVSAALPSAHTVTAVITGGPATCTISLQGSLDGTNWDTISPATLCTSTVTFYVSGKIVSKVRANLTALSGGASPTVTVTYAGSHAGSGSSGVFSGAANAIGQQGTPTLCDTATSGSVTAGQAQMIRCNTSGVIASVASTGLGDAEAVGNLSGMMSSNGSGLPIKTVNKTYNGVGYDAQRSMTLANAPTSQTITARNTIGVAITEKGSRWSVISNPAAGSQATASIAAEASVRHIVDCVSFSAAATTAPAATALTINVRDGATGAGTIIWTFQTVVTATTGQLVTPHSICGLNLPGTTNTAMTLEFSASLANLIESVSVSGFNVN